MVVVFLAILMLTGPVLHHRKVVGERGRVLVFVDASQSMKLADEPMEVSRKLLAARRLEWLPPESLDTQLAESADALVRARRAAGGENAGPARWRESAGAFAQGGGGGVRAAVAREVGRGRRRAGAQGRDPARVLDGDHRQQAGRPDEAPGISRRSPTARRTPRRSSLPSTGRQLRHAPSGLHPSEGYRQLHVLDQRRRPVRAVPPQEGADPSKKQSIAKVPEISGTRQWDVSPLQGNPIRSGWRPARNHYLEAIHKGRDRRGLRLGGLAASRRKDGAADPRLAALRTRRRRPSLPAARPDGVHGRPVPRGDPGAGPDAGRPSAGGRHGEEPRGAPGAADRGGDVGARAARRVLELRGADRGDARSRGGGGDPEVRLDAALEADRGDADQRHEDAAGEDRGEAPRRGARPERQERPADVELGLHDLRRPESRAARDGDGSLGDDDEPGRTA